MKNTKRRGGIATVLFAVVILAMLGATALLTAGTIGKYSAAKGVKLVASGNYAEAIVALERAAKLSLRPTNEVTYNLAIANIRLGNNASAKELMKKFIESEPNNVDARYELGKIYASEKDTDALRAQINALDGIGTQYAKERAAELRSSVAGETLKGFMNDIMDKVLPNGIPDALKKVLPNSQDQEPETEQLQEGDELGQGWGQEQSPEVFPEEQDLGQGWDKEQE